MCHIFALSAFTFFSGCWQICFKVFLYACDRSCSSKLHYFTKEQHIKIDAAGVFIIIGKRHLRSSNLLKPTSPHFVRNSLIIHFFLFTWRCKKCFRLIPGLFKYILNPGFLPGISYSSNQICKAEGVKKMYNV